MKKARTLVWTLATILLLTAPTLAQTKPTNSLNSIPHSAACYVHIDLPGLTKFEGLEIVKALYGEVHQEVDEVANEYWGIPASNLVDAAFVIPPDADLTSGGEPWNNIVGLLACSAPINVERMISNFPGNWKKFNANGRLIYVDGTTKTAFLHYADNAVAYGNEKNLSWFMAQLASRNPQSNIAKTLAHAGDGQITVAINGDTIMKEVGDAIPGEFKNLTEIEWATVSIDLSEGVRLKQVASFNSAADAEKAAKQLRNGVNLVKFQVKDLESSLSRQFANRGRTSFESTAMVLPQLAASRYGLKLIKGIKMQQTENQLVAEVHAKEFDVSASVLICLSAIQAVGTRANAEFEAIAAELELSAK